MNKAPTSLVSPGKPTCISVLCDLVATLPPGELLTFASLQEVLTGALDRPFTVGQCISAVCRTRPVLLRQHQRALVLAPRVGYRVAPAAEHRELAEGRKRRADVQLDHALLLLRHVRHEELTREEWQRHSATLQALEAVKQRLEGYERRQRHHEAVLADLRHRVHTLEDVPAPGAQQAKQ